MTRIQKVGNLEIWGTVMIMIIYVWLVVLTILKNITLCYTLLTSREAAARPPDPDWKILVNWKDYPIYYEKYVWNHQAVCDNGK